MFAKSTLLFAVFSIAAQLVAATPNACLLKAINGQPNPADVGAICSGGSPQVQKAINDLCGGDAPSVLSTYSDACQAAGKTIVINQVNSTSSSNSSSMSSTKPANSSSTTFASLVYTIPGSNTTSAIGSTGFVSSSGALPTGTFTSGMASPATGTAKSTSISTGAAPVNMANSIGAVVVFAAALVAIL